VLRLSAAKFCRTAKFYRAIRSVTCCLHGGGATNKLSIVDVRITHCTVCWGYRDRALALAEALRERFGAKVEIIGGTLGQFDVHVDGELVVSKGKSLLERMKSRRSPDAAKVIATIERHLSPREGQPDRIVPDRMLREFSPEDAKRFYDRFGAKQDAQFYENVALEHLLDHADFEHASAVFELGCGTGRLAACLFEEHLAESARYVGIDISTTMIEIATRRLARWSGRVTLRQADGTTKLPYTDAAFDRFVATYVLDLLPEAVIFDVVAEAHRILIRDGKLCVVASTEGVTPISRLLCLVWKRIYEFNPRLVGGCRPLSVTMLLGTSAWRIEHKQIVSSWGICSEIVIATPA
jgi:ubiquinone/menaquinone biosynthesis C-methylase UbiE/predicted Rdx family selenoprotein